VKKDDREIMNNLEAFDLTGSAHSAARLAGCDPKTVRHWVAQRDLGLPVGGPGRRERLIDPFLGKVEEWVDRSQGHVRADVVHERLVAVGFLPCEIDAGGGRRHSIPEGGSRSGGSGRCDRLRCSVPDLVAQPPAPGPSARNAVSAGLVGLGVGRRPRRPAGPRHQSPAVEPPGSS
jgi:hypothetical protein